MSERVHELTTGTRGRTPLVLDDRDRFALLACIARALGPAVLAYCLMDTHLHVVVEGAARALCARLERALGRYARAFQARHGSAEALVRSPARAIAAENRTEVAVKIRYVHENPVKARMVERALHYPWSSLRAYSGLCVARNANVERACDVLGPESGLAVGVRPALAYAEPRSLPEVRAQALLVAAAEVHGVTPWDLLSGARGPAQWAARALYLHLAAREGYPPARAARIIARERSAAYRCLGRGAPEVELRIARTLLEIPAIRARIETAAAGLEAVSGTTESHMEAPSGAEAGKWDSGVPFSGGFMVR